MEHEKTSDKEEKGKMDETPGEFIDDSILEQKKKQLGKEIRPQKKYQLNNIS